MLTTFTKALGTAIIMSVTLGALNTLFIVYLIDIKEWITRIKKKENNLS